MDQVHERRLKKQKTLTPTITASAKTTMVATKTLLDDANAGFKNGNFVYSPLSLEMVIEMLAYGAQGETLKQLLAFLGHENKDQLLSDSPSSKLIKHILSKAEGDREGVVDIQLANGVWVNKDFSPVKSCYQEILKTVYKTEAGYLDFKNEENCDEAAREINSWVDKKTKGLISKIAKASDFNEDLVIVLVNALYFKGSWSRPFDARDTKEKDFYLINGETVSVPFMTSVNRFMYGSSEGFKIIEFPYKRDGNRNEFSMYIFLPDEKDGLRDLLQVFHSDHALFQGNFNLEFTRMDKLEVPKFKICYEFDGMDVMKQMGLTLPFEETNTEFTGMVESTNMLYVSRVIQKAFIEVDEKGTEAAAISSIYQTGGGGPPPPPPPSFVADHPFMFMIREKYSRAVLFLGVVLNPLNNDA